MPAADPAGAPVSPPAADQPAPASGAGPATLGAVTESLLLAVAAALIVANAVFVAAEFSFITVNRAEVERRAEEGDARARSLLWALKGLSTQLSGAQLGITVTSLMVGWLAEPSLATLLRGPLGLTAMPDGAVTATSVALALFVATTVQMVLGELVPKNWAIAEPMRVGRWVADPQRGFSTATRWLIAVLNGTANAILRAMGIEPTEELASARSPQELGSLVRRSGQEGTLDPSTAALVNRSIRFVERRAEDVMTPRPRVTFVEADEPVACVLEAAIRTGRSRFPVVGESFDDVVGVVHFKHALEVPLDERNRRRTGEVMVPLAHVPDTMELDRLLTTLREPGLQMALVVDEYGGTAGIATLEDLVEEIVGEIEDEQDRGSRLHQQLPDGSWLLSGLLRPDEVADIVGLRLPESEQSETLAGLLIERLGRLPDPGDSVVIEADDLHNPDEAGFAPHVDVEVAAERMDAQRVARVQLRRAPSGATAYDGKRDE